MSGTLRALRAFAVVLGVSVVAIACGSTADDADIGNKNGDDTVPELTESGSNDPNAIWAKDPPGQWCGPETGGYTPPTPPGGTLDCPDDKNREGCPCTAEGQEAACWPGLRAKRNRGICQDGHTVCKRQGELSLTWGACEGYVMPQRDGKGKEACNCFSEGEWKLDNVAVCIQFWDRQGQDRAEYAMSTPQSTRTCYKYPDNVALPPFVPQEPSSENTLKVDCQGHFKLYLTVKAGDSKNPLGSDCVLGRVSTEGDYPVANEVTKFPALPNWVSTDTACMTTFRDKGGYAELSVKGQSWACENVDDGKGGEFVFQRFTYCPWKCAQGSQDEICKTCVNGTSGTF